MFRECHQITVQDNRLRWKEHIETVVKGANRILGLINRKFWFGDENVKTTLCKTSFLVRPKPEYASPFWNPHYTPSTCVSNMLDALGLKPLENRKRIF